MIPLAGSIRPDDRHHVTAPSSLFGHTYHETSLFHHRRSTQRCDKARRLVADGGTCCTHVQMQTPHNCQLQTCPFIDRHCDAFEGPLILM